MDINLSTSLWNDRIEVFTSREVVQMAGVDASVINQTINKESTKQVTAIADELALSNGYELCGVVMEPHEHKVLFVFRRK